MKSSRIAAVAASLFLVAASRPAQTPPPDPQSAWEPRTNPGAGQKFLEKLAGDWEVAKAFYPATGDPIRGKGTCRQRMIHGGRFLESDFTFESKNGKTTGLGLIGFEPETGRFTSVWTDERQTRMSMRHSRDPFDGKKIVLYSASLDEPSPAHASRTETTLEDGGRRLVHRQYAVVAGAPDRLMMELVMTRIAGTVAAP